MFHVKQLIKMKKLEACPICGNNATSSYMHCIDAMKSKETFTLNQCEECGFIFTNPRPEIKGLAKYYDFEDYISHSDTKADFICKCYHLIRKRNIQRKIKLLGKSKGKLLEIGSGTGKLLAECKKRGWETLGVEPNKGARDIASQKNNIDLVECLNEIKTKGSMDVVMLWHVLEHLPDINESFKKFKYYLKEKGKLVIAVPNCKAYDAKIYKDHWAAYDVPRHLSHFHKTSMKRLANKHGFEVQKIKPMRFDSLYVSILSEKIKTGKPNFIKGVAIGLWSNLIGLMKNGEYSSLIYIMKHNSGNKAI